MKKFFKVLALALCVLMAVSVLAACGVRQEELDAANARIQELEQLLEAEKNAPHPELFTQWLLAEENTVWRAVATGYMSQDPADLIPKATLEECLEFAYRMQFAGNIQFPYFVVIYGNDALAAFKEMPIEAYWKIKSSLTPGVAAVFVFTRNNSSPNWANFDAGSASGMLSAALFSKGWSTHWYCDINWTANGMTPIDTFLKGQGFMWTSASQTQTGTPVPVENSPNTWALMHCFLIGKPDLTKPGADPDTKPAGEADTYATGGYRGNNWGFWDPKKVA